MPEPKTIVYLCGIYSLGFGIFHIFFWELLKWKQELKKLSILNKGVMQILNVCLMYFFLTVAYLCFFHADELIRTDLGKTFLGAMSIFCLLRTIQQFIFIKIYNPTVYLLTIIFIIGSILFALPVIFTYNS